MFSPNANGVGVLVNPAFAAAHAVGVAVNQRGHRPQAKSPSSLRVKEAD